MEGRFRNLSMRSIARPDCPRSRPPLRPNGVRELEDGTLADMAVPEPDEAELTAAADRAREAGLELESGGSRIGSASATSGSIRVRKAVGSWSRATENAEAPRRARSG
jgi:hypothetical protein